MENNKVLMEAGKDINLTLKEKEEVIFKWMVVKNLSRTTEAL